MTLQLLTVDAFVSVHVIHPVRQAARYVPCRNLEGRFAGQHAMYRVEIFGLAAAPYVRVRVRRVEIFGLAAAPYVSMRVRVYVCVSML